MVSSVIVGEKAVQMYIVMHRIFQTLQTVIWENFSNL